MIRRLFDTTLEYLKLATLAMLASAGFLALVSLIIRYREAEHVLFALTFTASVITAVLLYQITRRREEKSSSHSDLLDVFGTGTSNVAKLFRGDTEQPDIWVAYYSSRVRRNAGAQDWASLESDLLIKLRYHQSELREAGITSLKIPQMQSGSGSKIVIPGQGGIVKTGLALSLLRHSVYAPGSIPLIVVSRSPDRDVIWKQRIQTILVDSFDSFEYQRAKSTDLTDDEIKGILQEVF